MTEVDIPRKRIGLTMRKDGGTQPDRSPRAGTASGRPPVGQVSRGPKGGKPAPRGNDGGQGALGAALMDAMRKR